jgi:hypothetical protein
VIRVLSAIFFQEFDGSIPGRPYAAEREYDIRRIVLIPPVHYKMHNIQNVPATNFAQSKSNA